MLFSLLICERRSALVTVERKRIELLANEPIYCLSRKPLSSAIRTRLVILEPVFHAFLAAQLVTFVAFKWVNDDTKANFT